MRKMASRPIENGALRLLQNYDDSSDSERDSGYTSEEDKKRKLAEFDEAGERNKKRRILDASCMDDEDMMVDYPHSDSAANSHSNATDHCDLISYHNSKLKTTNIDEDMAVDYPDYEKENCPPGVDILAHIKIEYNFQSVNAIPLPSNFAGEGPSGSGGSSRAVTDNPAQHEGRVRSFPHDPGNWASLFYLPLNEETSTGYGITSYDMLLELVKKSVRICHEHNLKLVPSNSLHISLSKTLKLRIHMIQPLAQEVRDALSSMIRFTIWLNRFEVYVNEEKTRTFLGLRVLNGQSDLKGVVSTLDTIFDSYKLPPFYKDNRLHASLAWMKGDCSKQLTSLLPVLETCLADYFTEPDHLRSFHVKYLHFKTGGRVNSIQLGQCL